ncbi:MAG: riboflavin synthase [Phycisphaerales bacterium]|nr:riboflavin synthase [Phycisphaerales bacterium]
MFTGIIQHRGRVLESRSTPAGRSLLIDARGWGRSVQPGESIAVNGCCLTVVEPEPLRFDVITQTLNVTTLGDLCAGAAVNLEPAVTPATLLSGHLVQGHVDGVGVIRSIQTSPEDVRVRIEAPPELMDFIVPKGSITVDGISLTLAEVLSDGFVVALIPTTLELTTLGEAKPDQRVNLETDLVVKTIVHQMRRIGTVPS